MKKLLIALSLILASFGTALAQSKVGHINAAELISIMPDTKKADAELQAYVKTLEDKLQKMQTDLQTKYEALQKDVAAGTVSEVVKEARMKELQDLDTRMQEASEKAQQEVAAKREALYEPILTKADAAIKAVAAQAGYAYVLDSGNGTLLVAPDADNLMPLLKKYLNITDAPSAPKAAPGTAPKAPAPSPAAPKVR
ncbi:MAG: hypothetical protein RL660_1064 [Bacteroidota bacterium]|jgi:outer membrane protein